MTFVNIIQSQSFCGEYIPRSSLVGLGLEPDMMGPGFFFRVHRTADCIIPKCRAVQKRFNAHIALRLVP